MRGDPEAITRLVAEQREHPGPRREPTTSPLGDRRERAVACLRCRRDTWNLTAICHQCGTTHGGYRTLAEANEARADDLQARHEAGL